MREYVGQFRIHLLNLAADKAYGSGEFLAWLLARTIQPHIPVIDRRHQTQGRFTGKHFRYEPKESAYYCPEENRSTIEVSGAVVGVIFMARQKRNVEDVHRWSVSEIVFVQRAEAARSQRAGGNGSHARHTPKKAQLALGSLLVREQLSRATERCGR